MMEFVSWDYEIPNWMESHKNSLFQTTNQLHIAGGIPHLLSRARARKNGSPKSADFQPTLSDWWPGIYQSY